MNLVNQTFGRLTVIRRAGYVSVDVETLLMLMAVV